MTLTRRALLKGGFTALSAWVAANLLKPLRALAAPWPKTAFESRKIEEALQNLFGAAQTTPSASIRINAPTQWDNGATVPFSVSADLPNVSTIAVLVEKNPHPLITAFHFTDARAQLSIRMKMAETSDVYVVVKSQGKLYSVKQNIKVVEGGCGG